VIRLGDIASIKREYKDPRPPNTCAFRTAKAVAGQSGVTMKPGGDVIELGKALDARKPLACRAFTAPPGLKLTQVSDMPNGSQPFRWEDFVEKRVAEAIGIVAAW